MSEPGDPPAASRGEPGSAAGKVESIVGARRLLTINTRSSSLKAALYRLREDTTETPELRAEASKIGPRRPTPRKPSFLRRPCRCTRTLYDRFTPEERFRLDVEAYARGDEQESRRLRESC